MPGSAYYIMDLHPDLYVPNNPVYVIINVCEPVEALIPKDEGRNMGRRKEGSGRQFKRFQIELLVVFSAIILIVTFFLDYLILERSGRTMQQNASNLISANSRQIELNINSYLERMETIPTLLFSDETYYLYDATDKSMEEYDKVKKEESIQNRIVDIGLMDNYADFGIYYSNDHSVGWISHGTMDIFPEGGAYAAFSEYATDPKTNDGWCFGIGGSVDRLYYIKRLNPNAILVSATYTRELASVFIHPEQLEEMTIRLVNPEDTIIYSSDTAEIGRVLPDDIRTTLQKKGVSGAAGDPSGRLVDSMIISDEFIINSNECENGWRVVCTVPMESILRENTELRRFVFGVSFVMALLFVLVGILLIRNLTRPMDTMVSNLNEKAEMDRLSGVLNKTAFEEAVKEHLKERPESDLSVMTILDMDNFKLVNDRLGHSYGDKVIIRAAEFLRKHYDGDTLIGRIGGDEFALYTECAVAGDGHTETLGTVSMENLRIKAREIVLGTVKEQMDGVMKEFLEEFREEREKCEVSVSAGVYITPVEPAAEDFETIYKKADYALYTSKRAGKARYTIYTDGPEKEAAHESK